VQAPSLKVALTGTEAGGGTIVVRTNVQERTVPTRDPYAGHAEFLLGSLKFAHQLEFASPVMGMQRSDGFPARRRRKLRG
jgi:hypothetical protein